ncbi:MAG: BatA domain-containing protein [Bacteroidetes Order II. Incertae sedis bacterium]|nr:BatA domain-containing protein [Bacteroidetes Order II. bacterium]
MYQSEVWLVVHIASLSVKPTCATVNEYFSANMTFLNPLILLGLLAAAIPILIHLFNFRKPKKVDFSTLAFLRELEKTAMQRVKIEQWLLLALRVLAILFLVLGFAQPMLKGSASDAKHAKTVYAIVIDNSLSMKLRNVRGEYLQQARTVAAQLVKQAQKGDEFLLLTTANNGLTARNLYRNTGPLLEEIRKIQPEPGARSLMRTARQSFRRLAEISDRNKEVYLISDLQRATFLDSLETEKPQNVSIALVPIGSDAPANVAITDVEIDSRIIEQGQPVGVTATLTNYSDKALSNFQASVYLEGQPVAQALANIGPKDQATVQFTLTPQKRGWLGGEVRIEGDTFEDDNRRYFSLLVPEKRTVLLVRGDGERTNFVELALSPQVTGGRVVFQTQTITEGMLGGTALESYNCVLIIGKKRFSSGEITNLKRYIASGGGLLMFPSGGMVAGEYTALFSALGGGKASGFSGQAGGPAIGKFDRVETEHPLFEGMFANGDLSVGKQVETVDARYIMLYQPGTGDEQTLIRLTNNQPFLHEIRNGKGSALLVTVAPDPLWSDLPSRGLFIPLLYRAVYYLSASRAQSEGSLGTSDDGEVFVSGLQGSEPVKLVGVKGDEYTPQQNLVYNGMVISVDEAIQQSGLYDVMQGDRVLRKVAVNADSRESDLVRMPPEEGKQQIEQMTGTSVRMVDVGAGTDRQIKEAIGTARFGQNLWNVFLFLALLCLLAEMFVALRKKSSSQKT